MFYITVLRQDQRSIRWGPGVGVRRGKPRLYGKIFLNYHAQGRRYYVDGLAL
jgi:hypothetical protein